MKSFFSTLLLGTTVASLAHASQTNLPAQQSELAAAPYGLLALTRAGDKKRGQADRWGAFAGSTSDGASGVGLDKPQQAIAEAVTMEKCRDGGGTNCEVLFVFLNQCAAVASTPHSNGGQEAFALAKQKNWHSVPAMIQSAR